MRGSIPEALDNVNIQVKPGQKIGLVGRTGSGKTTFASTFSRLVSVNSGTILMDGVDIQHIPLSRLRRTAYVLHQESFLIEGSLRVKLPCNTQHSDVTIWQALDLCGLGDLFRGRNGMGLDFEVGAGGKNLSAGQVQLLGIARAVLRRSKMIIIDEGL